MRKHMEEGVVPVLAEEIPEHEPQETLEQQETHEQQDDQYKCKECTSTF